MTSIYLLIGYDVNKHIYLLIGYNINTNDTKVNDVKYIYTDERQ